RAFALDASRHLGIAGKYPLALALPDRWAAWWLGGVISGMRAIERFQPKILWSTYPISTAHMIAATLAQRSGLPWIADFRDPMVNVGYPENKLERKVRQRIETLVMERAICCVFTTERAADLYRMRYPHAAAKCRVIENGYDEQAFTQATPTRQGISDDKLLLLHSGLIYPKDRDPSAFFAAINRLLLSGQLERSKLCIRFRAPLHTEELSELVASHGLSDVVDIAPPISYQEAIAEMLGADFLLVFQGVQFNAQIPAKIYEYLRARCPLIAMVDHRGVTAAQLRQFSAVNLADISSQDDIAAVMSRALIEFASPDQERALDSNVQSVQRYSRATQAETLASLFDTMHWASIARND
ncbi:MAG TPA: glycosyltransferase, partial [Gallionella sp.]